MNCYKPSVFRLFAFCFYFALFYMFLCDLNMVGSRLSIETFQIILQVLVRSQCSNNNGHRIRLMPFLRCIVWMRSFIKMFRHSLYFARKCALPAKWQTKSTICLLSTNSSIVEIFPLFARFYLYIIFGFCVRNHKKAKLNMFTHIAHFGTA